MDQSCIMQSPIGWLRLSAEGDSLSRISFAGKNQPPTPETEQLSEILQESCRQLREYFEGRLHNFSLPLKAEGSAFQQKVWECVRSVPYGQTASYREIAVSLGKEGGSRAVGLANKHNPLPLIIPCHRIIGADGSLTGYAGGLETKRWLLKHESCFLSEW